MGKIKVTVSKCSTQASKNGNFIHTLKTEGKEVNVLGQSKVSGQLTYFIALSKPTKVGTVDELDMDQFRIEERPYEVVNQTTGEMEKIMLKWLHVK
jgi:hypothetical protein